MHFMDSIFIFGLMLVLFGPKKLPEIARQAGKLMMEFRRASNDFKMQMEDELRAAEQADRQKKIDAETQAAFALTAATTATTASLPDGSTVQLASDGTTEPLTPIEETEPRILPPSVGETVSTAPPNRYRVEAGSADTTTPETVAPAPPATTEHATAEDFYAQRESELHPAPESLVIAPAAETTLEHPPTEPAEESALQTAVTEKLPGTEMYPDTAPMAESEQAPIHHG